MKLFGRKKEVELLEDTSSEQTFQGLIAKQFQGQRVRIVTADGQPFFVAKDVCDILELTNSRKACEALEDDEKNTVTLSDGIRGNPNVTGITESGLYALIFKSRKPVAREFRKWVTSEVLPEIRQTGSYSAQPALPAGFAEMMENQRQLIAHVGRMTEGVGQLVEQIGTLSDRVSRLERKPEGRIIPLMVHEDRQNHDMFDMVRAIYIRLLQDGGDRVELRFSELAMICKDHTVFTEYLSWDQSRRPSKRCCSLMGMALKNQFDNKLVKCDGELLHTCIVGRGRSRRYCVIRMDSDGYP